MELLGKTKRMQMRDKLSERAIANRTGLSRNTVHKRIQTPEEVEVPKYVLAEGFSELGDFTVELEQVLEADALRSKKRQAYGTGTVCANQGQRLRRRLILTRGTPRLGLNDRASRF